MNENNYEKPIDEEEYKRIKKRKRCFQRVISGLERGGEVRMITLTSSNDAPDDIQRSWRCLYMRLKRRDLIDGYIKIPEKTKDGKHHLHILYRGRYIPHEFLSRMWDEIHKSRIVDIRVVKLKNSKASIANYVAKYMSKESAGRYSWSWGWVWRGFCKHWEIYKKWWWRNVYVEGKNDFSNCLTGWKFWLKGVYQFDVDAMKADKPPVLVLTIRAI